MSRSHDPRPIGAELAAVLRARGWEGRLAAARVVARWPEVVGDAVAVHCRPSRLDGGGVTWQIRPWTSCSRRWPARR